MAITVLVADAKAGSRQELITLLRREHDVDIVGEARDGREALDMARKQRPSIVLLDSAIVGMSAIAITEEITISLPDTAVVMLIDGDDMSLVRRLMRAGARDVLPKPVRGDELMTALRSVQQTMRKQREALSTGHISGEAKGEIIAIYSPQGGAGKSMLAANLGVALAHIAGESEPRGRVVLVDLNLQFGDIDLMLNLNPNNTIAGLAQKAHAGIDADLVEQFLSVHEESGLRILVAPSTPQYAESVTVYTVEQVLNALRENYQFVIVDTPSQLQDTTLAALDAATSILLLTSLDLLALHKTRTALEMLRQLYSPEKIHLILNRADSEVGITVADVESALGAQMRTHIPSDGRLVVTSVNEGNPFVISSPNSVIARRINALALELAGRESAAASISDNGGGGGLLSRWFGV